MASTTKNDADEGAKRGANVGTYAPFSVTADDNFDEYEALRDSENDDVDSQKRDEIMWDCLKISC